MEDPADFGVFGAAIGGDRHIAVILADGAGQIRFWNAGAEAIFGHSAAEAALHRVDLVIPPTYREMHWAGFNRTIGTRWTGHDAWGEIEGLHKSGRPLALQVLLTPTRDENGLVGGVFAMFRRPVKSA